MKKLSFKPTDEQIDAVLQHLVREGEVRAFHVPGDDIHYVLPDAVEAFLDKHPQAGEFEWRALKAVHERVREMEKEREDA